MDYTQRVHELIDIVIRESGSDLHIAAGSAPTIRVVGSLVPLSREGVISKEDAAGMLSVLLNEEQQARFEKTREVDFSYDYNSGAARFRGNAYQQSDGIGIALRMIPSTAGTLEELNLPNDLEYFASLQQGFFLVVGPIGSGKTTTVASMIELINRERAEHIVTIEHPIEYRFTQNKALIHQREVRIDTDSFQAGLASMFREDVDVLFIGEMRDPETMSAAVTAAETGHLVLSTLHTNNASQTVDRIIDSFPSGKQDQIRLQLSASLAGIFSQRLIPRVSGGRIPAYELLINTPAVSNLIRERRTHEIDTLIETGSERGMMSMNRSLADLVRRGEITLEDARTHSLDPSGLDRLM